MLSKHKRPYDPQTLPPDKRLRANLGDVFSSNQLSARRTQELINDCAAAGVTTFCSLKRPLGTNISRNLKRIFLKGCQWPSVYWAQIRVWNTKASREELQWMAFLLPHEYTAALTKYGDLDILRSDLHLDPLSKNHLEKMQHQAQEKLVALGLWGDGVPVNYDRTESVETFSLNVPGIKEPYHTLRLPITAISRKQIGPNSWDDILEVVRWSLTSCFLGLHPHTRHDDTAWRKTDKARAKQAGTSLGTKSVLVEVRGDWKFFGETFGFPKHNTKKGCCWLCECTPAQVRAIKNILLDLLADSAWA